MTAWIQVLVLALIAAFSLGAGSCNFPGLNATVDRGCCCAADIVAHEDVRKSVCWDLGETQSAGSNSSFWKDLTCAEAVNGGTDCTDHIEDPTATDCLNGDCSLPAPGS